MAYRNSYLSHSCRKVAAFCSIPQMFNAIFLLVALTLTPVAFGQVLIVVNNGLTESVPEDIGSHSATVTRSGGNLAPFTLDYATFDISATAGEDYTAVSGTLVFEQGQTTANFNVPITNDNLVEQATETLGLMLGRAVGPEGYATQNGQLQIIDDDESSSEVSVISFDSAQLTVLENSGTALLTVTATNTPFCYFSDCEFENPTSVEFSTRDGTATAGLDYGGRSGTLTFANGQSTASAIISIPLISDTIVEPLPNETFTVTLSNPTNGARLGQYPVITVQIVDETDPPAEESVISFDSAQLTVNENDGTALLTVTATNTPLCTSSDCEFANPTSVNFTTSDGTATAGQDYTAVSGTLTFTGGQSTASATVRVPIINDGRLESSLNETFTVTLSNPTNGAQLGDNPVATVHIVDINSQPTVEFSLDSTEVTVDEDIGSVSLTVNRSGATNAVSVDYVSSDGTATDGEDYTAVRGRLEFGVGQTSATIDVMITDDDVVDFSANETFSVTLTNPSGGAALGTNTVAIVHIVDTSASSQVEFNLDSTDITINEADGSVSLTVNRTGANEGAATIDFATTDGTATAGEDYTSVSGTLTFAEGQTTANIDVTILSDDLVESPPNETFTVSLSNATGGVELGANSVATVQISDVTAQQEFNFASVDVSVNEGDGTVAVTVNRSGNTDATASVEFSTSDGSAIAGEDYTAASGTLTFAAGQTTANVDIVIVDDALVEPAPDQTFVLTLTNPSAGAELGISSVATINITDNDVTDSDAEFNFSQSEFNVSENSGVVVLTVNRSGNTETAVSVDYFSNNGTATAGTDFTSTTGTLTFAPGQIANTINVTLINDDVAEPPPNESFSIGLNNPTGGAALGTANIATITVLDDDGSAEPPTAITPPNAVANDLTIENPEGGDVEVTLDGSASSDPDGQEIVSYTWRRDGVVESNAASFTIILGPGEYRFSLEVADASGQTGSTDVTVIITRAAVQDETPLAVLPNLDRDQQSVANTVDDVCNRLNIAVELSGDQEDLRRVCSNLIILGTDAQKVSALRELNAEEITGQQTNAIEIGNVQLRNVAARLRAIRETSSGGVSVTGLGFDIGGKRVPSSVLQEMLEGIIGGVAGEAGGLLDNRLGIFVSGNLSFGDKDETARETGFDFDTKGITAGIDYRIGSDIFVGMAFGYGRGDTDFNGDNGGLETQGYSASAFGSYYKDLFYLDAIATYGLSDHESQRRIQFQDINRTANGDTDGEQISFGIEAGLNFDRNALSISPNLSVFHTDVEIDSFRETGANGLDLRFEDQNVKSFTVAAGVQAAYVFNMDWGVLRPQVRADYVRELENESQIINLRFVNDPFANDPVSPSAPITVTTDKPDKDYILLGIGVSAQFQNGFSGFIDWQTTTGYKDLKVDSVSFGLRWEYSF